ncbi:beta-lactamase/transpeptidase-like protein [Aspergillus granulosus]|uniref:Beta-lactamase/transpeptidase-like protein n=1 Tax=Aspergillus granulosus TaxID=176169 RepID=A0ABR4GU32_9EURO
MSLDTVFWVASFTKLLTSVACMQLVEQGRPSLDDAEQLEKIAPELGGTKVLTRTQEGAGFGYAFEDEKLAEFGRPVGLDDFSGIREDVITRPLVNQPGQTFQYGTSMDWVGIIIERITGLELEEYFSMAILQPLGMEVSFYPEKLTGELAYLHRRLEGDQLMHIDHLYRAPFNQNALEKPGRLFCAGGHGCFGKPTQINLHLSL